MAVTTISDYEKKLKSNERFKELSGYYESLLGLQTAAQAGYQQAAGQIQEQTTANISQAYANYLAQQRAYAEYPTISSGDVARLSSEGLSSYGTAYQAYKAKESAQLSSTASEYQKQLESGISSLNKEYESLKSVYGDIESALEEYIPTVLGYERNKPYSDYNYSTDDKSFGRLLALGTGADQETFFSWLLNAHPDLADSYLQNRDVFDKLLTGYEDIDTRRTATVDAKLRELTEERKIGKASKDLSVGSSFLVNGKYYTKTSSDTNELAKDQTQARIDYSNRTIFGGTRSAGNADTISISIAENVGDERIKMIHKEKGSLGLDTGRGILQIGEKESEARQYDVTESTTNDKTTLDWLEEAVKNKNLSAGDIVKVTRKKPEASGGRSYDQYYIYTGSRWYTLTDYKS